MAIPSLLLNFVRPLDSKEESVTGLTQPGGYLKDKLAQKVLNNLVAGRSGIVVHFGLGKHKTVAELNFGIFSE